MSNYLHQSPNFQTCRACNQWFSETWNFFNHCQKIHRLTKADLKPIKEAKRLFSKGSNILALRKLFETVGGTGIGDITDDKILLRLRLLYSEPLPTCPPDPEVVDELCMETVDEDEGSNKKDEKLLSHIKTDNESVQGVSSTSSNNEDDEITIIAEKRPKVDMEQMNKNVYFMVVCPICKEEFTSRPNLDRHLRRTHNAVVSNNLKRTPISSAHLLDSRSDINEHSSDTSYGVPVRKRILEPRLSCSKSIVTPRRCRELYTSELNYRIQSLSHRTVFEPMKCSCKSEMVVISERARKADNVSADLMQELKTLLEMTNHPITPIKNVNDLSLQRTKTVKGSNFVEELPSPHIQLVCLQTQTDKQSLSGTDCVTVNFSNVGNITNDLALLGEQGTEPPQLDPQIGMSAPIMDDHDVDRDKAECVAQLTEQNLAEVITDNKIAIELSDNSDLGDSVYKKENKSIEQEDEPILSCCSDVENSEIPTIKLIEDFVLQPTGEVNDLTPKEVERIICHCILDCTCAVVSVKNLLMNSRNAPWLSTLDQRLIESAFARLLDEGLIRQDVQCKKAGLKGYVIVPYCELEERRRLTSDHYTLRNPV